MNKIIDGRTISENIIGRVKKEIEKKGLNLKLGAVLVGDNPISLSYISQKEKICRKVGISFSLYKISERIKENDLIDKIFAVFSECSGLIVQLPLPKNIDTQLILNAVPPEKDIDLLSAKSLGKFYAGDFSILPPVVSAIEYIFKKERISLKGKNVAIIGSGKLVGKPLAVWMMARKATLSVINEFTDDISFYTKKADIVISGVGKPNLIKGKMIKKGAIVIDAGSSVEDGRLKGDIHLESVLKKGAIVSPVPGGVGPITTACLLENLIKMQSNGS